ncbi:MAG: LacI family transcriptional regulator [Acidobacteria bacterium]|nr:LacI family transcriptional regulator [Acidobacteriota bacterium]
MAGVTLRQIADQIGCSRSTVSYALKNNPNISPGRCATGCTKVAEELGLEVRQQEEKSPGKWALELKDQRKALIDVTT